MANTLTATGVTLVLDPDLYWADEFDWSPVEQGVTRSITGALIIQTQAGIKGRPITLRPDDDGGAWMPRSTALQLLAWAAVPDLQLTLTLFDGFPRTVIFRHHDQPAASARPVVFFSDAGPADWYLATLKFMEV